MHVRSTTHLEPAALLAEHLRGDVIAPGHPDYDEARRVWNGMIDRRPALIARCAHADDVATATRFASEHDLRLAVRGGGHNVAGTAVVDDGLVVDLSAMRAVSVDSTGRTVHVQGGATWADVDRVTAPLGLATPVDYTRAFWDAAVPFSNGQTDFNFPGLLEEGDAAVRSSYGSNHPRLARIKVAYDPDNRFRLNQNIRPAMQGDAA